MGTPGYPVVRCAASDRGVTQWRGRAPPGESSTAARKAKHEGPEHQGKTWDRGKQISQLLLMCFKNLVLILFGFTRYMVLPQKEGNNLGLLHFRVVQPPQLWAQKSGGPARVTHTTGEGA